MSVSSRNSGTHFRLMSNGQDTWQMIAQWGKFPTFFAFDTSDLFIMHKHMGFSKKKAKVIQAVILITMWCLWKARKDLVFNQKQTSHTQIIEQIKALGFLWMSSRAKGLTFSWEIGGH
ncbi:hypothetical protein HanRHA438_Chr10g0462791 [Helianthus annuus]|nr:hypothetical protein HanRHA438_Chr10g0462791 [Helianthus annuus]